MHTFLKNETTLLVILLVLVVALLWVVFFRREGYVITQKDEAVIYSILIPATANPETDTLISNTEAETFISIMKKFPKLTPIEKDSYIQIIDKLSQPQKEELQRLFERITPEKEKKTAMGNVMKTGTMGDGMKTGTMGDGMKTGTMGNQMGDGMKTGMMGNQMGDGMKTGMMGNQMGTGRKVDIRAIDELMKAAMKTGTMGNQMGTGRMGERKRYSYQPETFRQWAMKTLGLDKDQLLLVTTLADGISLNLIPFPSQGNLRSLLGNRMRGEQINSVYERFVTMAFVGATPGKYLNVN